MSYKPLIFVAKTIVNIRNKKLNLLWNSPNFDVDLIFIKFYSKYLSILLRIYQKSHIYKIKANKIDVLKVLNVHANENNKKNLLFLKGFFFKQWKITF